MWETAIVQSVNFPEVMRSIGQLCKAARARVFYPVMKGSWRTVPRSRCINMDGDTGILLLYIYSNPTQPAKSDLNSSEISNTSFSGFTRVQRNSPSAHGGP